MTAPEVDAVAPRGMTLPKIAWVIGGTLFAAASIAIHYQVKVAMHEHSGAVQELGRVKVGQPAPDFTLSDVDGKPIKMSSFGGRKAVLLDFWATWCGPCRMALPDLQALSDKYKERGLEVLAIDQGESADQVGYFLKRRDYLLQFLLDPNGAVGDSYGVRGIPTSVLVDKDGFVQAIFVGAAPERELERQVELVTAN
jgi:peroxiredoxin